MGNMGFVALWLVYHRDKSGCLSGSMDSYMDQFYSTQSKTSLLVSCQLKLNTKSMKFLYSLPLCTMASTYLMDLNYIYPYQS